MIIQQVKPKLASIETCWSPVVLPNRSSYN